jgi:hypothetical protein
VAPWSVRQAQGYPLCLWQSVPEGRFLLTSFPFHVDIGRAKSPQEVSHALHVWRFLCRYVISAASLYRGVRFQCWVLTLKDGTHVALSKDFPETVGHCRKAESALRDLRINAESTLESALLKGAVYRQPLFSEEALTIEDVLTMLDQECADMVDSIGPTTSFVVFDTA